jgi:WD40 repeat protein
MSAFSPDGSRLAVVLEGQRSTEPVRLLDTHTMKPTVRLDLPGGKPVFGVGVSFSADGRYLAASMQTVFWGTGGAGNSPGYALVWDLRSPSTPPVKVPTGTNAQGSALSPDGQVLYTEWPLTAWRVSDGEQLWQRPDVWSLPFLDVSADGALLAVADSRQDVTGTKALLVSASTGSTVHTLRGHRAKIRDIRFSPDGRLVGTHSDDGELVVWDTITGDRQERWSTAAQWGVGFSPDGDLVYEGGGNSMLRTWDRSVTDTYVQRTTQVAGPESFASAEPSPDGQQVAYRWLDDKGEGWVRFVGTATGDPTPPTRLTAVGDSRGWGTWHPDGGRYLWYRCSGDPCSTGTVSVLDSTTGELVRGPSSVDGDISGLAYVDEGRSLLAVSSDRSFVVDAETLRPRGRAFDIPAEFDVPVDNPIPIGDGTLAMVRQVSGDGTSVHWWVVDIKTGDVASAGGLGLRAYASVASPDGSTVAMAGQTGEIVSLDVSTGDERWRSASIGAEILWLDYSEDGDLLVSGADDGGVSLWDATTLDLLGTVRPPHQGDPLPAAAHFIADSHDVAIASYDGTVYRWETDLDRAIDFACRMAGRDLTADEWDEFLPTQPRRPVCPEA